MTTTCASLKNAAVNNAYIGSFAEQLINGVNNIVIFLSLAEGSVLVAIIAGTEHPKPISIGTKLLPDKPIFLKILSIKNATRAIYPVSSSIERKKNKTTSDARKYTIYNQRMYYRIQSVRGQGIICNR